MTFPISRLGIRMRIAPYADLTAAPSTYTWIDVTTYVDTTFDITDKIGSTDEASETNTELSFTFRNNDARFTTDNPEGPWYLGWDVGCPIEYAKDNGDGGGFRDVIVTYLGSCTVSWTAGTEYRCIAEVTAGGLFRRLGLDPALASPLRRSIPTTRRKAYLPLEDATGSTRAASGIPAGNAAWASLGGIPPDFGTATLVAGASSMATFKVGSTLHGELPSLTTTTGFRVSFLLYVPTPPAGQQTLYEVFVAGSTVYRYGLEVGPASLRFRAWNSSGTELSGAGAIGFTDQYAGPVWLDVDMVQSGANVAWAIRSTKWTVTASGVAAGASSFGSGSFAAALGAARAYSLAPGMDLDGVVMSHWALTEQPFPAVGGFAAVVGWVGNTAAANVVGLCNEFGVPVSVVDPLKGSIMGPQVVGSLLANLRVTQQTDHGVLSDHTGVVTYRTLQELYNLTPALTLSRARRGELGVIAPVRDDTVKVNIASASRPGGSSFTAADLADVLRSGRYEREPLSVNVATDAVLPGHAGWALARGTAAGQRYQSLEIKAHVAGATTPTISTAILALSLGDRISLESLPPQAAKGGAVVQVRGRTQVVSGRTKWKVTYDLVPTNAYDVFVLDTDRLDTSGTEVIADATTTATTLMTSTAGALPATGGGQSIPLDAGGENVTLTAVAAEPITDTFSPRAVVAGWGSVPATAHLPAYPYSNSGTAADYNVAAGVGTQSNPSAGNFRRSSLTTLLGTNFDVTGVASYPGLATGAGLEIDMEYRATAASNCYTSRISISTAAVVRLMLFAPGGTLLADVLTNLTHTAGVQYSMRIAPIGTRHLIRVWQGATQPTGVWHVDLLDETRVGPGYLTFRSGRAVGNTNSPAVCSWDSITINNTQAFTVTRSVNGVVKTQLAPVLPRMPGAAVKLWQGRGFGV
jgi:hypothetical protein